jgi:hypothetical protein
VFAKCLVRLGISLRGADRPAEDTHMENLTRTRLALAPVAILVAAVIMSAAVAVAAIPDGQGIIHGCYRKSNGTLRVLDKAKGQHCVTGERALDWNERARRGRGALADYRDDKVSRASLATQPSAP